MPEILDVKSGPSINAETITQYKKREIINSGDSLIKNEDKVWLRYTGGSGNKRYVCAIEKDDTKYFSDIRIKNLGDWFYVLVLKED